MSTRAACHPTAWIWAGLTHTDLLQVGVRYADEMCNGYFMWAGPKGEAEWRRFMCMDDSIVSDGR